MSRLWAWILRHPLVGLAGVLLGVLGVQGVRLAHLRRRQGRLEANAERADVRAKLAVLNVRAHHGREDLRKAADEAERAAERASAAARKAAVEIEERERIASKYRNGLLLLPLLAISLHAGPLGAAEGPCVPDTDLGALLVVLDAGEEPARDAAEVIRGYQRERAALCEQIGALRDRAEHLGQAAQLADALAHLSQEQAEDYRLAWERALGQPKRAWRDLLGLAVGPGLCLGDGGRLDGCVAVLFGLRL